MSDAQDHSERREPTFGTPEEQAAAAAAAAAQPETPVPEQDAARLIQAVEEVMAPRDPRRVRLRRLVRNMFRLAIERSHVRVALVGLVWWAVALVRRWRLRRRSAGSPSRPVPGPPGWP